MVAVCFVEAAVCFAASCKLQLTGPHSTVVITSDVTHRRTTVRSSGRKIATVSVTLKIWWIYMYAGKCATVRLYYAGNSLVCTVCFHHSKTGLSPPPLPPSSPQSGDEFKGLHRNRHG